MTTIIAKTLGGKTLYYASCDTLRRALRRRRDVIVDHWTSDDPPPIGRSDARVWDDYRTRHGYAGER